MSNWIKIREERYRHPFFGEVTAYDNKNYGFVSSCKHCSTIMGGVMCVNSNIEAMPLKDALAEVEKYQSHFEKLVELPKLANARKESRIANKQYGCVYATTNRDFCHTFVILEDGIQVHWNCFIVSHDFKTGIVRITITHQYITWSHEVSANNFEPAKILNLFELTQSDMQKDIENFEVPFWNIHARTTGLENSEDISIQYTINGNDVEVSISSEKYGERVINTTKQELHTLDGTKIGEEYLN